MNLALGFGLQKVPLATLLNQGLKLYCDTSVTKTVYLKIAGVNGADVCVIDWGDGSSTDAVTMDGTQKTINHVYSDVTIYTITVTYPENILGVEFPAATVNKIYPANNDIAEFNKCVNLENFLIYPVWVGSINGFNKSIKEISIYGNTVITGDITPFTALVTFVTISSISGVVSAPNIKTLFFLGGAQTCTIDITGLTKLETLESYALQSYGTGDISTCPKLKKICYASPNTFTGDFTDLDDFIYLDHAGDGEITGDVTLKTGIWKIMSMAPLNNITGSIDNLTLLQFFQAGTVDNSTITKPTRLINQTLLCLFNGQGFNFLSAEVDAILADVYTNKDAAKIFPTNRMMYLDGGTSEPAGDAGIINMAKLLEYRSPTPPGTADLWDVRTKNTFEAKSVTGWTNLGSYPFETFTSSGSSITQAVNSAGGAACYTNSIGNNTTIAVGDRFLVKYTMVVNSGTPSARTYLGAGASLGRLSNLPNGVISAGRQIIIFTMSSDGGGSAINFVIETTAACDISLTDISIQKITA